MPTVRISDVRQLVGIDMAVLLPIPKSSLVEDAVEVVTDLITSGEIPSGTMLPAEAELSRQLGISRPTVREALRTLEARGLIVSRHGVGALVIDQTSQVAASSILLMLKRKGVGPEDMLEVRLMLECQAASLSAQRATDDDVSSIVDSIDAMRAQPRPPTENVRLDFDFHMAVARASHNLVLVALVDAIRDLLYDTIAATHASNPDMVLRVDAHAAVLDAIRRHDASAAAEAMAAHLKMTEFLIQLLRAKAPGESEEEAEPVRLRPAPDSVSRHTR